MIGHRSSVTSDFETRRVAGLRLIPSARLFASGILPLLLAGCVVVDLVDYYAGPPDPPELEILDTELSPDGKTVVMAFRFRDLPLQLATAPLSPEDGEVTILDLPKPLSWRDPTWSADGQHLAAVSRCSGAGCYGGASGHVIWRMTTDGSNLERMVPAGPWGAGDTVFRQHPVFGNDADELFFVEGDSTLLILSAIAPIEPGPRSLLKVMDGAEYWIVPTAMEELMFWELAINASINTDRWLLLGRVHSRSRHPVLEETESAPLSDGLWLFSVSDGAVELERAFRIIDVGVSRKQSDFVFVKTDKPQGSPQSSAEYEFYLAQDDGDRLLLKRRKGFVWDLSVSDDLNDLVFNARSAYRAPTEVWHYDVSRSELIDLKLTERLMESMLQGVGETAQQ